MNIKKIYNSLLFLINIFLFLLSIFLTVNNVYGIKIKETVLYKLKNNGDEVINVDFRIKADNTLNWYAIIKDPGFLFSFFDDYYLIFNGKEIGEFDYLDNGYFSPDGNNFLLTARKDEDEFIIFNNEIGNKYG